jgi:ABC-type Mn2+/Zn2+ transport system ATPase subunit
MSLQAQVQRPEGPVVVSFDRVGVRLGERRVLEEISFSVHRGDFIGLIGPNGAGKTTLLRALLGLVPVSEGRVEVFGLPPGHQRPEARRIGYVPQRTAVPPSFPATVGDVVMMGLLGPLRTIVPRQRNWAEVARSLALVGLSDRADRPVGRLSGGEQRRVLLAQALCAGTQLLVLDEPTIGLDLPAEHEFYELLRRLQHELGLTVLVVSHDLVALAGQASELLCINRRVHVHGRPRDVVHSHALQEAYSCEFDFLAGELRFHGHDGGAA